jgi:PAS domain S-box-containing protein
MGLCLARVDPFDKDGVSYKKPMMKINIKRFFLDRPIKEKVGTVILAALSIVFVLNVVFLPARQKRIALDKMISKGEIAIRMATYDLRSTMELKDLKSIDGAVKSAFQDSDLCYVSIFRFQSHDTLLFSSRSQMQHIPPVLSSEADTAISYSLKENYLTVTSPIREDQRIIGRLVFTYSLEGLKKEMAGNRLWVIGLNCLMLVAGVIITGYLSSILTKPIRQLTGVALLLTEGKWGAQVSVENQDEVGALAHVFNQISSSLKQAKEKLDDYNQTLEQKVEERTRELRRANDELSVNGETISRMLEDLNLVNRELAKTKNQLENIFKSVVDRAIITVNTEGRIIYYSKSSELVFGYEAYDVVGKKYIQELFSPHNDFLPIFLEHTREAGIYKGEAELLRRGREVFPAMLVITPLQGEGGVLTGYTFMVEDITQKRKTNETLHLLSSAVESAADGVVVIDLDGKILFINPAHASMHGYKTYEMLGKYQKDFYPQSYWPMVDQALQQILVNGSWSAELEEPRKDGDTFPMQITASLIKDPQGRPVGILGVCRDISEKKKMEQEIIRSNRELAALNTISSKVSQTLKLKEILEGSLRIMLDLTQAQGGWVSLVNQENQDRLLLLAQQGLAPHCSEDERDMPYDKEACWEAIKSKLPKVINGMNSNRTQQTSIQPGNLVETIIVPLISKDEVLGVMSLSWRSKRGFAERELRFFASIGQEIGIAVENALLFEDVQKAKDSLQKLNFKLEEASKIKSEFLANTSHELRTPLNSIIGFLGLILDGYCINQEEEKEFARNAQYSAKQLLAIINDVLDLAKIEAGKMKLELEGIDLKMILDEVCVLTQVQAQQKKLNLALSFDSDPPPRVYADGGKLKQVMINLVGNAIKFTDKGEVVIRVKEQEEKGNALIVVEDTGIGIPAGMQDQLYEKFRQVDGSSTRKYGGTGLGLTITKNLVEMMGGKIKLESPGEGKGTKVTITMPLYRQNEKGEGLHDKLRVGVREGGEEKPLALVLEDDPAFSDFLAQLLQDEGFSTVLAQNADDAMYLVEALHPGVILLDYSFPQKEGGQLKDGGQLIQMLQKKPETKKIPVTFITGQDLNLIRKELSRLELESFPLVLSKPVPLHILTERIRTFSVCREKENSTVMVT